LEPVPNDTCLPIQVILGSFVGAFFSGSNLPPAAYLCGYVFINDPMLAQTKMAGYEKYIAVAGLVLFLASFVGVWKICKTAWDYTEPKPAKSTASSKTQSQTKAAK
jgi:hypothetical protein